MVNLTDVHSPCVKCYISRGYGYSPDDYHCNTCEYYIALGALKKVLKSIADCQYCSNVKIHDDGNLYCRLKAENDDFECITEKNFIIDWIKLFEKYGKIV